MPVVTPVPLTFVNVTFEPPRVMPLRLRTVAPAPPLRFAVPETLSVPPPVARKLLPVTGVVLPTFSVPLKVMIAPVLVVRLTPADPFGVCVPVRDECARGTLLGPR